MVVVGLLLLVMAMAGPLVTRSECVADLAACLAPGEQTRGQNVCIEKCEIECLGQRVGCTKTTRCTRCLACAFVGCGVGDRVCIEARVQ